MGVNLNKIANDIFNTIEKTFDEQVIRIYTLFDVKQEYTPGSGNDPAVSSDQGAIRAVRKKMEIQRTQLPQYEINAFDILILVQDLPFPIQTGSQILTDEGPLVVLRTDMDAANVTMTLMCKVV